MKRLILVALMVAVASPAVAASKAYLKTDPDKPNGIYNGLQRSPQITPSVQAAGMQTAGCCFGSFFLEDDGLGTVSMIGVNYGANGTQPSTLNTTGFMMSPPGAFLYVRSAGSTITIGPQGAPGSSDPSGSIDWGVLTGWSGTGDNFCRSTPPFVCTFISRIEDGSVPLPQPSATYDIGTWNFDGNGDFDGTPYISGTQDGGISNTVTFLRGTFKGSSLPALPLLGFAALAASLAVAGGRFALRKK